MSLGRFKAGCRLSEKTVDELLFTAAKPLAPAAGRAARVRR